MEWSWHSAGPRWRHLRIVSVETPYRLASTPVGSGDRAISARTEGVVRALGWIVGIRTSSAEQACHAAQSAKHAPRSPNQPDPSNLPRPDTYYYCVISWRGMGGDPRAWGGRDGSPVARWRQCLTLQRLCGAADPSFGACGPGRPGPGVLCWGAAGG